MDNTNEITQLKAEIERQKQIINDLETRLKKYTNNPGHKKYLEEHKDKINTIKKTYYQKLKTENPEKLKAYYHRANQKRLEKKSQQSTTTDNN
jgi:hypothetical protein